MKAILVKEYGGPERLVYQDHHLRKMEKNEVLIAVKYAGVNFPDGLIIRGKYQFKPELPFSPGGEVSGVVEEVGKGVSHLEKGDKVVAVTSWGGYAEQAIASAWTTFRLPDGIPMDAAAATLVTFGTVAHGLKDRSNLQKGERLVVLGAAGGVGSAAVQLGKAMGAEVVACASSEEKLEFCKKLGADRLLNYSTADLKLSIKDLGGADVIFDPVGGVFSEAAFRSINPLGRHLVVGFATGSIPALPWNLPLLKNAAIVGVFFGRFWRFAPKENRENIEWILQLLKEKLIDPFVEEVLPLQEAAKAIQRIENREVRGKLVLEV